MKLEVTITNYSNQTLEIEVNEEKFENMLTKERNELISLHMEEYLLQNFSKKELLDMNKPFAAYYIRDNKNPITTYKVSDNNV